MSDTVQKPCPIDQHKLVVIGNVEYECHKCGAHFISYEEDRVKAAGSILQLHISSMPELEEDPLGISAEDAYEEWHRLRQFVQSLTQGMVKA